MTRPYSAALPVAYVALRILIVSNSLLGIGIALLFALPHEQWLMTSLKLVPSPDTTRFVWGMRAVAGLGLVGVAIGGIGAAINTPAHPIHLDAGFSPAGWLAVLLTFILARVFAEGTIMREDLEGTV